MTWLWFMAIMGEKKKFVSDCDHVSFSILTLYFILLKLLVMIWKKLLIKCRIETKLRNPHLLESRLFRSFRIRSERPAAAWVSVWMCLTFCKSGNLVASLRRPFHADLQPIQTCLSTGLITEQNWQCHCNTEVVTPMKHIVFDRFLGETSAQFDQTSPCLFSDRTSCETLFLIGQLFYLS